jgi:hypothetical protein
MDEEYVDLTGLFIFDSYGVKRVPLAGEFNAAILADRLVADWIPYYECHKCGRFDYCKFVERIPQNPALAFDIKCGIFEAALRVFVETTFHLLPGMTTEQRQDYLDAVFHYGQFVYSAELMIGSCIDKGFVEWWEDSGPRVFGQLVSLRDRLDSLAAAMQSIPEFRSQRAVLFVEGWSEKAFLDKMRESHSYWFLPLVIEVYDGKGNRRPKRIEMLLDRYVRHGYKVFIQGDADGKGNAIFDRIVEKDAVTPDRTFVFTYDFETAVPASLMLSALQSMGELEEVDIEQFQEVILRSDGPVSKTLKTNYGLDLEPLKLEFATQVADILNYPSVIWWNNENFMQTELGRFLRFIQGIS